jgi:hypothetical protein
MRLPRRIIEHPIEAAIAGLLLLGLLFGSADFTPSAKTPLKSLETGPPVAAQKF